MNLFRFSSLTIRQTIRPSFTKQISAISQCKFFTQNVNLENGASKKDQEELKENENPVQTELEKKLHEENIKLQEKIKIIDHDYKTALAQTDNMIKRKYKEIEETKKFAIQSFSKDLLEVADILSIAVNSVPKEEVDKNKFLKSLYEGVLMTEKQLQTIFKRNGIVKINPIGNKFNPNEHEAIMYVEDKTKEPYTVFTVNKVGYKLQDRVIRAASVGVVKE